MKRLFVLVLSLFLAAPAQAQSPSEPKITVRPVEGACFTQAEAIAEQAIRIHSELMVIGLNCQHMTPPGQKNLYQSYREFTATHSSLFAQYENTLLAFYRRNGAPAPEQALNAMRTDFANKIALDVAKMRPDRFCRHYMPRIQRVSTMQRAEIQQWAGTFYPSHPPSRKVCQ